MISVSFVGANIKLWNTYTVLQKLLRQTINSFCPPFNMEIFKPLDIHLPTFSPHSPQEVRSSQENCLQTAWRRWSLSSSAPRWSGTTCTPMTMTPDVSSWGHSRVESLSLRTTWEACYWTQTASLRPITFLCIHLEAGTEQGRRRAKVRGLWGSKMDVNEWCNSDLTGNTS